MLPKITLKTSFILWLFFISIICLEFILFRHRIIKDIADYYPVGYDQTFYLVYAYNVYENIQHYGLISGLYQSPILTNGILFPLQAVLSFSLFGVSRFNALLPNIIYFFALQLITLYALSRLTNKKYPLLLMLGLILCLQSPIQLVGGIFDFRMDAIAFCLYGILIASVIRSEIFLNKRWSFFVCLCIILMILMRGITLTYSIGVIGTMTVYLFYAFKTTNNASLKSDYKIKLFHCFSILIALTCTIFSYIWLNYKALYNYYVVNHFLNSEKHIRAAEEGIKNIYQMLSYYPLTLFHSQIGCNVIYIILAFFAIYILPLTIKSKKQITTTHKEYNLTQRGIHFWHDGFIFLIISFLIPIIILTMDTAKSPIVGTISIMPVLWLVIWCIFYLDHKQIIKKQIFYLLNIMAIFTLTVGIVHQIKECSRQDRQFDHQDLSTLNQLYDDIGRYAVEQHWKDVSISTDRIVDYVLHTNVIINYYEKHGILLNAHSTMLGGSIFSTTKENLLNALKNSNVVIFNISNDYPAQSPYPANLQIAEFKPLLTKYADTHFDRLGDYKIKESIYRVYVEK